MSLSPNPASLLFILLGFEVGIRRAAAQLLSFTVDTDGGLSIRVGEEIWLRSSALAWVQNGFRRKSLTVQSISESWGSTAGLGDYAATAWEWGDAAFCEGRPVLRTEVRNYSHYPNAIVLEQSFPCGVPSIHVRPGLNTLSSGWPSLAEEKTGLSWATFNGRFAHTVDRGVGLSTCQLGIQGGSPLILYDEPSMTALIASQLTQVKTGEMQCSRSLTLGLKGTLTSVPANYSASWVLTLGTGIARSMEQWGDFLLAAGQKERTLPYSDPVASSLGYWTDNGAYFHYPKTGPTTEAGGFHRELQKAHAANKEEKLPFRHWQLDSWWYEKGKGGNGSSRGSGPIGPLIGLYQWTADPFVFPEGVPALQRVVDMPFVLHNRWFAPGNWYKQHGIPPTGWTDGSGAGMLAILPLDGDYFWDYFFQQQKGYGLQVYEQDFLWMQYDLVPALRRNATMADDWLRSMADAAHRHGLTIQYCMPYPRDYIASTRHKAVTTIRASDDYHPNNANWRLARQSLLAWAVGLLPFKDTFLSSGTRQTGGADLDIELSPELQTLVSVLAAAMVGPGDGPHLANRTMLMQTCREDGILLKADRPAIPIDAAWTSRDPGGELSWSFSKIPSKKQRGQRYVFAAALERSFNLTVQDLELSDKGTFVARNWYNGKLVLLAATSPILLSNKPLGSSASSPIPFEYWTISEALDGWVLLGEIKKYITASTYRISSVQTIPFTSMTVTLKGVPGEQIHFCVLHYPEGSSPLVGTTMCSDANVDAHGLTNLTFANQEPLSLLI